MNRLALAVVACTLGVSACSHVREPTDAQLVVLLHSERNSPGEPNAQLDSTAIKCLRAWSGDEALLRNLPPSIADEDGRKTCHGKIDAVLADATRNPETFAFADVTAPKVVRRAVDLDEARRLASLSNPATHEIPPALIRPHLPPAALGVPDPSVDLGVAGAKLVEAEDLCKQAQQAAAQPAANPRLKGYAKFCAGNLRQLRGTMQQAAHAGQNMKRLDSLAGSATNMANIARNLLAAGNK